MARLGDSDRVRVGQQVLVIGTMRAATDAPAPLEEPPVRWALLYGFFTWPVAPSLPDRRGRGDRAVERVHVWMADGRREPSDDLLEWPGRDNADLRTWTCIVGISLAQLLWLGRGETLLRALLSG